MSDEIDFRPLPGTEINVGYSDETEELRSMELDAELRVVALQLERWASRAQDSGVESVLERSRWAVTENPYDHMARAHYALATSDVVAGVAELVEGLAYQGVKWEAQEPDIADIFNQMAAEQNLDAVVRRLGREEFACSQVVVALWWDKGTFKVRGVTKKGHQRKTTKDVWYPSRVTVLDPRKVLPVGLLAFGAENLVWRATDEEFQAFRKFQAGELDDEIMKRFYIAQYEPSNWEVEQLMKMDSTIDPTRLILLNPKLVKRHTLTRSDYERFAPVRLRAIFQLLDLRQQLMEADRVALIGAVNYLMLVKKGSNEDPAHPTEISNLRANFKTVAKVPIIFSDHRLEIEIITPKQDHVLQDHKYDLIDKRIIQRLLNTIGGPTSRSSASESMTIGKPVGKALESRRHMLRRFLEVVLAREVVNDPRNEGLTDWAPSLVFVPASISITDDSAMAQAIINLRTMREVSRESTLEFFGLDEGAEAMRMLLEQESFDDIFKSTVPFSANPDGGGDGGGGDAPANQAPAGNRGGRPEGGGSRNQNPTNVKVTDNGNTSTKGGK